MVPWASPFGVDLFGGALHSRNEPVHLGGSIFGAQLAAGRNTHLAFVILDWSGKNLEFARYDLLFRRFDRLLGFVRDHRSIRQQHHDAALQVAELPCALELFRLDGLYFLDVERTP